MTFEELLKNEIETQYGSVYNFSKVIGVSRSVFSGLLSGTEKNISPSTASKICKGLGLDLQEFKNKKIVARTFTKEEIEAFERETAATPAFTVDPLNPLEKDLLTSFRELSIRGQFKVIDYVNDIMNTYRKE